MRARAHANQPTFSKELKREAGPFLKWAGGKGQLLRIFEPFYPQRFGRYFEPFIGGGAVFFSLGARHPGFTASISDYNSELVNCYQVVKKDVEKLIAALRSHQNDSEYYYHMRALDLNSLNSIERASRLIYLNKTCFNGLYRVNRSGQFNVPFGKYKNPRIVDEINLRNASRLLQKTKIHCASFEEIVPATAAGDFVYLDPPYQPLSTTANFTSYTARSFSTEDQTRLRDFCRELDKRGCLFMLSNSDNELIEELYQGFKIERVMATRAINCKGNRRGRISELLIRNYEN